MLLKTFKKLIEWYELQLKGLGSRYKNQTQKQINALKNDPYLFSVKYKTIRCKKIEKFPFLIHYQIDEKTKTVTVFAVFHTLEILKFGNRTTDDAKLSCYLKLCNF